MAYLLKLAMMPETRDRCEDVDGGKRAHRPPRAKPRCEARSHRAPASHQEEHAGADQDPVGLAEARDDLEEIDERLRQVRVPGGEVADRASTPDQRQAPTGATRRS